MSTVKQSPHILFLNPWITDFAAHNLWIRPLGLLSIASHLIENGFKITLIDCLDYYSKIKNYGEGNFLKTKIEKPPQFKLIPRHYSQYGIPEEMLLKRLSLLEEKPDLIGITSGMTYWYPGVFKLIGIIRNIFKEVPIILGGIYASLCNGHAQKHSGADIVYKGGNALEILKLVSDLTNREFITHNSKLPIGDLPYPAFDLYPHLGYVCIVTSGGCPFRCTYCASHFLTGGFSRRDPDKVVNEIEYWVTHFKVNNIAFYDDALLVDPSKHFIPIMQEVIKRKIHCNFHTPNAIHVKEIDEKVAHLLFQVGFKTIRLGLETSNESRQNETGGKVGNQEFREAIKYLKRAGYSDEEIGVYIMTGLPDQRVGEVEESITFVRETGARPMLVEYSPIPHTPLFEKAKQVSQFDLENEPLFHNNTIFPCQWEGFTMVDYRRLKEKLKKG